MEDVDRSSLVELTTASVAAYVEKNAVPRGEMPGLIASFHSTLAGLGQKPVEPEKAPLVPAVPVKEIRYRRLHHQPRGRAEDEDDEALSRRPRYDAR